MWWSCSEDKHAEPPQGYLLAPLLYLSKFCRTLWLKFWTHLDKIGRLSISHGRPVETAAHLIVCEQDSDAVFGDWVPVEHEALQASTSKSMCTTNFSMKMVPNCVHVRSVDLFLAQNKGLGTKLIKIASLWFGSVQIVYLHGTFDL